jgi:hypothetical protein
VDDLRLQIMLESGWSRFAVAADHGKLSTCEKMNRYLP